MEKTIYSHAQETFRHLLREVREEKGIKQTDLARALGRPQSFIAKVETGQRRLDVMEFLALTDALGVPAGKLLDRLALKLGKDKRLSIGSKSKNAKRRV